MKNSDRMLLALEQQDLEAAQAHFQKALAEDSDQDLLDLGEYLESIGFLPQAKLIYEQLLDVYPEFAINLAHIAMEDGETEAAFGYLDLIGENSPYYLEALAAQADFYQMEGLADVAREKLLLARQLSDEPLIRFGLAEIDLELERYQEAVQLYADLDNRLIHEETGVSTYQRIGLAYAQMGRFEAAVEFLEKAVELEYDDQTLFELAALLFEQNNYQRANLYFKQLEVLNPNFEGYEYLYAQSLHAEHQIEEALSLLQRALTKNELDPNLLLLASQYAYELGDRQLSENYLLQARDWAEDLDDVTLRLSNLYLEDGRFEEAAELDRDDIDSVLARWNIAKAYRALEDEAAFEKYAALANDLANNPEFLREYGLILREVGNISQAKDVLSHYLILVPDDADMAALFDSLDDW